MAVRRSATKRQPPVPPSVGLARIAPTLIERSKITSRTSICPISSPLRSTERLGQELRATSRRRSLTWPLVPCIVARSRRLISSLFIPRSTLTHSLPMTMTPIPVQSLCVHHRLSLSKLCPSLSSYQGHWTESRVISLPSLLARDGAKAKDRDMLLDILILKRQQTESIGSSSEAWSCCTGTPIKVGLRRSELKVLVLTMLVMRSIRWSSKGIVSLEKLLAPMAKMVWVEVEWKDSLMSMSSLPRRISSIVCPRRCTSAHPKLSSISPSMPLPLHRTISLGSSLPAPRFGVAFANLGSKPSEYTPSTQERSCLRSDAPPNV
mmetsp:Transcript_12585/g.26644  ORF Transcript_12585/g.26644 Transcript_12585/m.26644 type:complete len:321 (-) Transcript_12585:376-1338(-)